MNCYTEHMDNNLLYSLPRLERQIATTTRPNDEDEDEDELLPPPNLPRLERQIATTTRTNDEVEDEDDEPPTVMPVLRRQIADMTVV
jgi:hypothetical protein